MESAKHRHSKSLGALAILLTAVADTTRGPSPAMPHITEGRQNPHQATIRPFGVPLPVICFAALCAVLLGPWIGFYLFNPFGFDNPVRDSWHHVAVFRELMIHPFTPSNPHIPTDEGSRYYTPITLLAAFVGRILALTPYSVFNYLGAISLAGLGAGCWSFGRIYFKSIWAPSLLLLSFLFAWGDLSPHAGFHDYATWLSSAAYPSMIALVLGLFFWSATIEVLRRTTVLRLALFAATAGVIFLEHQLSGAIMLTGAGSLALFRRDAPIKQRFACIAAIAVGCLMSLAWPYFSVIDVLASSSDDRWLSVFSERNRLVTAMGAAIIPLVGIVGFRKPAGAVRLELIFPTVAFLFAYLVMQLTGSPIAHRLPPAFILFAQLGLVWAVVDRADEFPELLKRRLVVVVGLALFVVTSIIASVIPRVHELDYRATFGSTFEVAQRLAAFLPANSVSFATETIVYPLQSTGRRVVSIPRPEPAAPSLFARQQATDAFFNEKTTEAGRRVLIDRWGATHTVFRLANTTPALAMQLRELGSSKTFPSGIEVVTFDGKDQDVGGKNQ